MAEPAILDLRCHPTTPTLIVRRIRVSVLRPTEGELHLAYRLDGDISRIRIPPLSVPRIGKELWRHTCFEAFIKAEGQAAYHEFNFAPSREWTVYALSGYRNGGPLTDTSMEPHIAMRSTEDCLELKATIRLERLSQLYTVSVLEVGLSAVIETTEGMSYWALCHPGAKPDFHHSDSFALQLPRPSPTR
ncbi:MAG TPA: DOMON-like domain-containing protein [Candidatus Binataceae bacterium]|nr:DOMON-like domain-containing protein [Candidatus Binataceae bacterium]